MVAHPYEGKNVLDQLPGLAEAGLDGVETYYQGYGPDRMGELLALCAKLDILPTGGTDFHGFPHRRPQRRDRELSRARWRSRRASWTRWRPAGQAKFGPR